MGRLSVFAVALLLLVVVASCGDGTGRGAYIKANERLFATLPSFPGTRLDSKTSTAYRSNEDGPVAGYGTRFDLKLPTTATAPFVSAFFRRRLEPQWHLVETLDKSVFNYRRGKAFVSVNLENAPVHLLEIAVDHAYYGKLGR
jgi:hypothetical protein